MVLTTVTNSLRKIQMNKLFATLDRRTTVTLKEVSDATGIDYSSLRKYAKHNLIPGAVSVAGRPGQWCFIRKQLEIWWAGLGMMDHQLEPRLRDSYRLRNRVCKRHEIHDILGYDE